MEAAIDSGTELLLLSESGPLRLAFEKVYGLRSKYSTEEDDLSDFLSVFVDFNEIAGLLGSLMSVLSSSSNPTGAEISFLISAIIFGRC